MMAVKTFQHALTEPLLSQSDEQSPPGSRGNAMSVRFAEAGPGGKVASPLRSRGRAFSNSFPFPTPPLYTNKDLTGPFVDYLVRMCAKKFNCRLAKAVLDDSDDAVKDQQYEEALDQVRLERLMASLSIVFTCYYKEHDPVNWKAKGTEFKDHVSRIIKYKRQQIALNSEVDNWIQRDKLLRPGFVMPALEPDEARQGRLQQFWKRYHTSYKLNDVPADFQLEASPESPPMQTEASNPSPAASEKMRESSSCSALRSLTPGGDAWKLRGSRSFCSRGGCRPGSSQSLTRTGSRNASTNDAISFPSLSATSTTSSGLGTSLVATRRQAWNGMRTLSKGAPSSRAGSKSEDLKSTEEGSHADSSRAVSKSEDGSFLSSSMHGTPAASRPSSRCGTSIPAASTLLQPLGDTAHQSPTIKLIGVDSLASPPPRRPSKSWAEDPKNTLFARCRAQTELATPSRGGSRSSSRPGSKHGRGDTPLGNRLRMGSAPVGDLASSRSTSRPGSKGISVPTWPGRCGPGLSSKDSSIHGSRIGSKRPPSDTRPPAEELVARPRFVGSLANTLSVADLRKWGFEADSTLFSSLASQMPQEPPEAPEPPAEAPPASPQKLRKQQTKMLPYDNAAGAHALRMAKSGANSYVDACTSRQLLPSLKPFCTGHSSCLSAPGYGLTDNDLLAVVQVLPSIGEVSEINLEGNSLLTEASLGPLLGCLEGARSQNLKELSLKDCMRKMTVDGIYDVVRAVSMMLIQDMQKLKDLSLSGIPMTTKLHLPLCEAIRAHPSLKRVGLAGIKLGTDPAAAARCMSLLLANGSLQSLDLGWNTFDEECFRNIGLGVVADSTLKSLSLASCSCLSPSGGSSVETFIEIIEADRSLTNLDLSNNRIDFRGALVMEAALELNPTLRFLDLQSNPLGSLGLRSLLRLMARSTSGISSFNCEACVAGSSCLVAQGETNPIFSETNPSGRYELHLDRLYDRALLKMLCRTGHRMGMFPEQAFGNMVSDFGFQYPVRTPDGHWPIPTAGKVSLTFSIRHALETTASSKQDTCFQTVLDRIFQTTRLTIPFAKQVPILALWKKLAGQTAEQGIVLEGLSKDFHITVPVFTQLCEDKAESSDIANRLFANMVGGQNVRFLSGLCVQTLTDYLKLMRVCRRLFLFNVENPTGHYHLDLANWCDYSVAEQLLVLDRWECILADKAGLAVVSQGEVRSSVRNALHEDRKLPEDAIAEFNLPEYGHFIFDYSSLRKPPLGAKALTQEPFRQVLLTLQRSGAKPLDRVKTVTMTSHFWYLDCLQLRALTGIFESPAIRAETFVRLASRIVDLHNEKVCRSRFANHKEFQSLLNRLGHVFYFPFIQPEQTCFSFQLAQSEQRVALHLLFRLSREENKDNNIRDAILTDTDGTVDELLLGLPDTWQTLENISRSGTLTLRYECSPDDRNYAFRASLMETYGYVQPPPADEVLWWSSTTTCPPDVVEFVEFLNASFHGLEAAFEALAGTSDAVSLQDFEDGVLTKMGCRKFHGPRERERVRDVFRYLDPSGEGLISQSEWRVLDQIFKEVQLSVKEFVQFCERTFGTSWQNAWNAIDVDGSGEINADEWNDICKSYGFFGPSRPIFSFLDADDTGSISAKEFDLLKEYSDGAATSSRRKSV